MAAQRYRIHGLELDSEIEVSASKGRRDLPVDLTLTCADGEAGFQPDGCEPVAGIGFAHGYDVWRQGEDFWLRFPGKAHYRVGCTEIVAHLHAGMPREMLSLFAGSALSLALIARGALPLHASAVEVDGGVIALIGSSGMGKSTIAGLLCASGLRLVADDVLRAGFENGRALCYSGSLELRLRPGSRAIANLLPTWTARQSLDGRLLLRDPSCSVSPLLPLRALIIPEASSIGPTLTRLSGVDALVALLSYPRLLGWRDPQVLELLTRSLATLARSVPVYRCGVRRDRPLNEEFACELRDVVLVT